jgi:hypothetical protein
VEDVISNHYHPVPEWLEYKEGLEAFITQPTFFSHAKATDDGGGLLLKSLGNGFLLNCDRRSPRVTHFSRKVQLNRLYFSLQFNRSAREIR